MDLPRENRIRGERSPSHNSEEYQYLKYGDKEKYLQRKLSIQEVCALSETKMSCNLSLLRLWSDKLKQDEPAASVGLRFLTT